MYIKIMQSIRKLLFLQINSAIWRTARRQESKCFRGLSSVPSIAQQVQKNVVQELISKSAQWKVTSEEVLRAVQKSPKLLRFSPSQWDSCFNCFDPLGFRGSEVLKMLWKCPELLGADLNDVQKIWHALTIFRIPSEKLIPVLINKPYILCNSPSNVLDKAEAIINFAGGKNNSLHVLNYCENPFALSIEELNKVIEYVQFKMRVRRQYEICRSCVVETPLLKLKVRHTFLVYCGLYAPQKEDIPVTVPHSNPRLFAIVNTSDAVFATKTAEMTLEEFTIFQDLFEKQYYDDIYEGSDDEN